MLGLLDRMERKAPEQKIEAKQSKGDLAEVQARISKGLGYLEAHFAKEPPKSDPKYEGWDIITWWRERRRF